MEGFADERKRCFELRPGRHGEADLADAGRGGKRYGGKKLWLALSMGFNDLRDCNIRVLQQLTLTWSALSPLG